jgi:gas vesicle protein
LFGAGLALGVILGAGGALLTAPRTGAETRAALGARAARFRRSTARRGRNAWDDLRDELQQAKRSLRNRKRRRQREIED